MDSEAKIIDFGLSAIIDPKFAEQRATHLVGTPSYLAPECLLRAIYSPKTDAWYVAELTFSCRRAHRHFFAIYNLIFLIVCSLFQGPRLYFVLSVMRAATIRRR
jgi:serine/threonine protein kinase